MNAFDDLYAAAAVPSQMAMQGEPVVYVPRDGAERPITLAIVDRSPPERTGPNGMVAYKIELTVPNDLASGITSAELDTGGDQVRLALENGGDIQLRRITNRIQDSGGMLVVAIG